MVVFGVKKCHGVETGCYCAFSKKGGDMKRRCTTPTGFEQCMYRLVDCSCKRKEKCVLEAAEQDRGWANNALMRATTEALEAEIERRKEPGRPAPKIETQSHVLRKSCARYLDIVEENRCGTALPEMDIFRDAMEMCYGEEIWPYINYHRGK